MDKSLQIFLSYGHDKDSKKLPIIPSFIEQALLKRNHSVWVDIKELPNNTVWPNSDWRSEIFKAINKSDAFLCILSEHGLRTSGVCLDEIAIAVSNPGRKIVTVLIDDPKSVRIPATISRIEWVDMSEWKTHFDFQSNSFIDDFFDQKIKEIISLLENPANIIYQYDMNFLLKTLSPSRTVNAELYDLIGKEFDSTGSEIYEKRDWIDTTINNFIQPDNKKHYLLFYGGPGFGKSQFTAHAVHNIPDIYAYYFIKYDKTEKNCNLFLRTIAFELAAKIPEYRVGLISSIKEYPFFDAGNLSNTLTYFKSISDSKLFDILFHCDNIRFIDGYPGSVVITIDALDEGETDGLNPYIEQLIAKQNTWPNFFKFILTSRDYTHIIHRLQAFGGDIELVDLYDNRSNTDIKNYLRKMLSKNNKIDMDLLPLITEKCEKSFIYANLLVKSVNDNTIAINSPEDIKKIPSGYSGLLLNYFKRVFTEDIYSKLKIPLGIMVANNGLISKNVLASIMKSEISPDWSYTKFLSDMRSFVTLKDGESFAFFHKTLNDWLVGNESDEFHLDADDYNRIIFSFCKKYISLFNNTAKTYGTCSGFEVLKDSEANGFNYEICKYVYCYITKNAPASYRKSFYKNEIIFVTTVHFKAYKNSELPFADDIFQSIRQLIANREKLTSVEKFYIALAYSNQGEIEIARDRNYNKESIPSENDIIEYDKCNYALDYFIFIKHFIPELQNYCDLYASTIDNIAFIKRLYDQNSAINMLIDLKKYLDKAHDKNIEKNYIHLYYHMGVVYYNLKEYDMAIDCLKTARDKADNYKQTDAEFASSIKCIIYNQLGACFNKKAIAQTDVDKRKQMLKDSLHYAEIALDLKIECYGEYSFYVGTAYDNLARWKKDSEQLQDGFNGLSDEVYDIVKKAIKIKETVFSKNSKTTARSYMTMAYCFETDKKYYEAVDFSLKAYKIDHIYAKDLKRILQKAIDYSKSNNDIENESKYQKEFDAVSD